MPLTSCAVGVGQTGSEKATGLDFCLCVDAEVSGLK